MRNDGVSKLYKFSQQMVKLNALVNSRAKTNIKNAIKKSVPE